MSAVWKRLLKNWGQFMLRDMPRTISFETGWYSILCYQLRDSLKKFEIEDSATIPLRGALVSSSNRNIPMLAKRRGPIPRKIGNEAPRKKRSKVSYFFGCFGAQVEVKIGTGRS